MGKVFSVDVALDIVFIHPQEADIGWDLTHEY